MKEYQIHEAFIEALENKIPKKTTLADFIANLLCVEKETAYRRLRGEVQFSLREAALIAQELNISIDQIMMETYSDSNNMMVMHLAEYSHMKEDNSPHIIDAINYLRNLEKEPFSEFGIALATIPFTLYLPYSHLARFYILKCNYHERTQQANVSYESIKESDNQLAYKKELYNLTQHISSTYYIWDRKIMPTLINDIKYFKSIRLIKDHEIKDLKNDLNRFLDDLEQLAANGKYIETGNNFKLYISDIHIDVTHAYIWSERMNIGILSTFIFYMMTFKKEDVVDNLSNWVKSLKRSSILVSDIGERERIRFFDQQRKIVDSL